MKPGNEDPAKKYERQRSCKHRYDAWNTPEWDPKNKYRTCERCEHVEVKQIRL